MTFIKDLLGASTVLGAEDVSVSEQSSIMLINMDFLLLILFGDCLAPWILGLVSFHFGKPTVVSLGVPSLSCCLPQKL